MVPVVVLSALDQLGTIDLKPILSTRPPSALRIVPSITPSGRPTWS
jgi:hypothetical protein